jgi:hypothetical protein
MMVSKKLINLTVSVLALLLVFNSAPANSSPLQKKPERETALKASFLLNLSKFIYWPKKRLLLNKRESLVLCFPGEDPFQGILETAQKESLLQMDLEIKKFVPDNQMRDCNILFLTVKEDRRLNQILSEIKGAPVVTVADTNGFAYRGAMINFIIVDNKIRFKVNRQTMESNPIKLSSEILDLSIMVDEPLQPFVD